MAQFAYDAFGCRIRKTDSIADTNTLYYYGSGWQVLAEYNGAGTLQRRFVYGNYIDEPLVMNDGSNDYYYAQDHLYSSAALLDSSGSVVERYEYDAYGNPYILTPQYAPRNTSQYGNPYMFTGREVDILDAGSLKIQYNRNRYYDFYTGRWLTQDPRAYVDGVNLYTYVRNNPYNMTDSFGTCTAPPCEKCPRPEGEPTVRDGWHVRVFWRQDTLLDPIQTRWVNYQVNTYIEVSVVVFGPSCVTGEYEDSELIQFNLPFGYQWPNYQMVDGGLRDAYGVWNPEGKRYACRKKYVCRQKCSDETQREWEEYRYGVLRWDTLGGAPECGMETEDPSTICFMGCFKCGERN